MLDRIDAWIADGVLNGPQLNVADFMVAPSLALILYRDDVRRCSRAARPWSWSTGSSRSRPSTYPQGAVPLSRP